jgi:hypothetical protein
MSGRGGIYEGPGGQNLYGDGREVNPIGASEPPVWQLRDIDALIAEKIFGWEWWMNTERRKRLLVGPSPPWDRWNWAGAIMRRWNGDLSVQKFSDWDRACALRDPRIPIRLLHAGLPYYSINAAASKELRDRMRELGWKYRLEFGAEGYLAAFSQDDGFRFHEGETEEMAAALAALRAGF